MFQDRGFHYENGATDETRNSKRQGRIRVQAGDKRVPPAKSKPRQRRQVTPADHSSLCMDCVDWSDRNYSVKQLVRTYSGKFPIIVKVTQGYYDNGGLELTTNEVLQIHDSARQTRVDAVDSLGRNLSLPADLPVEVTPTDGPRAGDRVTLAGASVSVPVKVKVLESTSEKSSKCDLTGQTLLLRSVADDVFLRANAINGGWIDQTRVIVVPSMFGAEFAVAEGMRGATNDEWTDYRNMFSRTVRHLMLGEAQGYPEIFVAGESRRASEIPESIYENQRTSETPEPLYDNYRADAPTNPDLIAAHRCRESQYINLPLVTSHPDTTDPSRPETPFSEIDEDELGEMFADVIKEGQRLNAHLTDVCVEVHTPPPETEGFGSVKNLLQNFGHREEKTGIDNRGQDYGPPRAVVQPTVQKHSGGERTDAVVNHSHSAFVSVVTVDSPPLPASHERKIIYDDRSSASLKAAGQSAIRTVDDVPESTDSLTVADVSQCLRLLNMEAHVTTFENHQVDGGLLCGLTEKVLCDDFRLTPFNASKLLRFARGWRPKLS